MGRRGLSSVGHAWRRADPGGNSQSAESAARRPEKEIDGLFLRSVRSLAVESFGIKGLRRPQEAVWNAWCGRTRRLAVAVIGRPLSLRVASPFLRRPGNVGPESCVTCVFASSAIEIKGLAVTHRSGVASAVGRLALVMAITVISFEARAA